MPAAVNCLVIEPISNTVSGFTGTFSSRLARPYAAVLIGLPSRMIISATPGMRCDAISLLDVVIHAISAGEGRRQQPAGQERID